MKYIVPLVFIFLLPFFAEGLAGEMKSIDSTGVQLIKLSNGLQVWTKRVGEGPNKILLLHGGPGYTHECFECFESFFPKDAFQIIYYDQLGSYYSDQPNDPSLWTIERFCEEVEQVRQALGLDQFYLYGFSWGSMLAIEYALKYQTHLKGLILSNMTASTASYEAYMNQIRKQLPPTVQNQLDIYERNNSNSAEYEELLFEHVFKKHICRLDPWPEPLWRSVSHFNKQVCDVIFGPNDFVVTGNCKHWDRWDDLVKITVPTLVMGARYDTVNPKDIERMGALIPHAQVKICENGSHCCMYDDQEAYFTALHTFFRTFQQTPFPLQ